jgi:hypothetical protein
MRTPDNMESAAVDVVTRLLSQRLKGGNVSTSRPDFYFQCEAGHPVKYPGGFEVRVRTWRYWSSANVYFDADNEEMLGYSIPRYADPPTGREMSRDEALFASKMKVEIPPDAELESFYHFQYTQQCKVAQLEWKHIHQGLRVYGDYISVVIHPETFRVIEYFRRWRKVRLRQPGG